MPHSINPDNSLKGVEKAGCVISIVLKKQLTHEESELPRAPVERVTPAQSGEEPDSQRRQDMLVVCHLGAGSAGDS